MLKRAIAVFLLSCFLMSTASAESLSQFMFKTTMSMSIHEGEVSLLVIPSAKRVGDNNYNMKLKLLERGGVEAAIDSILIHVFNDDFNAEDEVYKSSIGISQVSGSMNAEEKINADLHQWVGYEVVSGDKHFYGVVQCGDWDDQEMDALDEEESIETEDRLLIEAEI